MFVTFLKSLLRIFIAAAGAAALMAHALPAAAQNAEAAKQLFGMAAKAIAAGDYKTVVKQLSGAMASNKLSSNDIARALFLRGVAFQQGGAPARAISDLTNAIWLTGLNPAERARSYASRALAYRKVGMDARANADLKQAKEIAPDDPLVAQILSGGQPSTQAAAPAMGPQSIPMPMMPGLRPGGLPGQPAGFGPAVQIPQVPAMAATESPKPKAAAAPQQQEKPKQVAAVEPAPAAVSEPAPAPVPSAAPATPRAEFPSWATSVSPEAEAQGEEQASVEADVEEGEEPGRLKRFFGSIWGSDDEADSADGDGGARRALVATAEWSKTTKVEEINDSSSSSGGRSYRIQLASSRSEDEARTLWKRISSQYSGIVGDREPIIEKTELGTLGTFYRLQLGPFDDKRQSLQLCNSFKRSGVECFLVTR